MLRCVFCLAKSTKRKRRFTRACYTPLHRRVNLLLQGTLLARGPLWNVGCLGRRRVRGRMKKHQADREVASERTTAAYLNNLSP